MQFICPSCQSIIDAENVNVATDLATCTTCNEMFKVSELMAGIDLLEDPIPPPAGSKIVFDMERGECGSFFIPKRGFKGSDLFSLLFATFWICFIAFWTWGVSQSSLLFAAFSIPFWVVGITMWKGILINISGVQYITTTPHNILITKNGIIFPKQQTITYSEIESIDVGFSRPRIVHGTKKTYFAENVSEAEMKWLIKTLKAAIFKKKGLIFNSARGKQVSHESGYCGGGCGGCGGCGG